MVQKDTPEVSKHFFGFFLYLTRDTNRQECMILLELNAHKTVGKCDVPLLLNKTALDSEREFRLSFNLLLQRKKRRRSCGCGKQLKIEV